MSFFCVVSQGESFNKIRGLSYELCSVRYKVTISSKDVVTEGWEGDVTEVVGGVVSCYCGGGGVVTDGSCY